MFSDQFAVFYLVGLYIAFAGGLWSMLVSYCGRNHDALSTLFISRFPQLLLMLITLAVGLYSVKDFIDACRNHLHLFLSGSLLGAFAVSLRMQISKDIPIGTLTTITAVCFILTVIVYEYFFMTTFPTRIQFIFIALIMIGTLVLVRLKNHHQSFIADLSPKVFLAAVAVGIANGISLSTLGDVGRKLDPVLTTLTYNIFIMIIMALILWGRWAVTGQKLDKYSPKALLGVLSIGVIGFTFVAGLAYGSSLGSFSVLSAIEASAIVFAALLSWLFLGEKLSNSQWGAIIFVTLCIAGLRFTG